MGELWGMSDHRMGSQLNTALTLSTHFDLGLAAVPRGTVRRLPRESRRRPCPPVSTIADELATLSRRLEPFLRRHLRPVPGLEGRCGVDSVLTCTPKQLRNRVSYEIRRIRSADAEERFRRAHAQRDVTTIDGREAGCPG